MTWLIRDILTMIVSCMLHHLRSKGQEKVTAVHVFAKYGVPSSCSQHCHHIFHKNCLLRTLSSDKSHLHKLTILNRYVPEPQGQASIIDVPQRYLELLLAVKDLEHIMTYGLRNPSERRWKYKDNCSVPLAFWITVLVWRIAASTHKRSAKWLRLNDSDTEDPKLEL